jgi:hypothetical protein
MMHLPRRAKNSVELLSVIQLYPHNQEREISKKCNTNGSLAAILLGKARFISRSNLRTQPQFPHDAVATHYTVNCSHGHAK